MMKKYILIIAFCGVTLTSFAQKQLDKVITREYVDHLIKTLSRDDMEGRGTFTPGIEKAAVFIEGEFKKNGLQTLPGLNSYRQSFYKIKVRPEVATVNIDGEKIDENNVLVVSNVQQIKWNSKADAELIKFDTGKDFFSQFRSLAQQNKKALVLVDKKFMAAFKRIRDFKAKGGTVSEDEINPDQQLVFILDRDTVANNFQVNISQKHEKLSLSNVVGVIPGKSKAKEYVVFGGHYDHLGILKPVGQDSIANGADDDASGTTAVIALARYYKKMNNNERTLIFVAFTAEEIGGFGSQYFSKQLNPDDVVAMFNIEMIGKESKFGKNTAFITGFEKSDLGKILQKNLEKTAFKFYPDPYPSQQLFYRSDNATLAALGVPAHTISTDQIDTDKLYHSVKDEYASLDVDNIVATIKAIALSSETIIKGVDAPTRIPKLKN